MSREDAERSLRALGERLALFGSLDEHLDDATLGAVSFVSDAVSGAGRYRDYYERDARLAGDELRKAHAALKSGNLRTALRFLNSAAEHIESAGSERRLYLGVSAEGGETAIEGGVALGVGVASGGIGGFFGLSLALHGAAGAALNVFSGGDEKPESSDGVSDTVSGEAEEESEGEVGSEREAVSQCIMPEQMTGETSSVAADQCRTQAPSNGNEDEEIFRAVDGPVSSRAVERRIEAVVAEQARAVEEWKPPVVEKPTPPAGGYKMRSREELIAEAQRILAEWKRDPNIVHDYAAFLIDSEFLDASDEDATERHAAARLEWDSRVSLWKAAVKEGAGTDFIMADAYGDYEQEYSEGATFLSDFLGREKEKRRRNCESQAKFVVAAHTASGARLKKSEVLAVQFINAKGVFGKLKGKFWPHIDAIVYDREGREKAKAPLYDPHIFFHGFLKKQGVKSPASDSDFLIPSIEVEPPLVSRISDISGIDIDLDPSNTNLDLPSPGGYFSDDYSTEYTAVRSSRRRTKTGGVGKFYPGLKPRFWDRGAGGGDFMNAYNSDTREDHVIFRTREQADEYNALPTPRAKREFLIHLTLKSLEPVIGSPEMKLAFRLMANPSEIRKIDPKKVNQAIQRLYSSADIVSFATDSIGSVLPPIGAEKLEGAEMDEAVNMLIQKESPFLKHLAKAWRNFESRITARPAEFIAFLEKLPPRNRLAMFNMLSFCLVSYGGNVEKRTPVAKKKIAEALANPMLIGIRSKRPGYKPQSTQKLAENGGPVEIEMVFLTDEEWASADRPGQKGDRVRQTEAPVEPVRARREISKDTMIDFIFRLHRESDKLAGRWTQAISRRFLRLNRDGRYDEKFMSLLPDIANARSKSGRKVTISAGCGELLHGEFGKLSKENKSIFENTNCHLNVPPDIAEIVEAIQKRRDAKNKFASAGNMLGP